MARLLKPPEAPQRRSSLPGNWIGGLPNFEISQDTMDWRLALDIVDNLVPRSPADRKPHMLALHREWYWAIAYFLGLQGVRLPPALIEDFAPELVTANATGFTANHMFRIGLATMARLSDQRPGWEVTPKTPDQIDQDGAKAGTRFLDHTYDEYEWHRMRRELAHWLWTCGTGGILTDWNPKLGPKHRFVIHPATGEPIPAESLPPQQSMFLQQHGLFQDVSEGDFEFEIVSPFHLSLPHRHLSLDRMDWIGYELVRSVGWVWENYGRSIGLSIDESEMVSNARDSWRWRLHELALAAPFLGAGARSFDDDAVVIRKVWLRPEPRWPEGFVITATWNRILDIQRHPFPEIGFPLELCRYSEVPGRLMGNGVAPHLIAAQQDYNDGRSDEIIQRKKYGKPQIIAPVESGLRPDLDNNHGTVWTYKGTRAAAPTMWNPPAPSAMHQITRESALFDMERISAMSEASQASVPPNVRSGLALRALQAKDDTVIGHAISSQEECMGRVGKRILQLAAKFITVPRAIQIHGEYELQDVLWFVGSDLNENHRVRVKPGSMKPRNKVESQEMAFELVAAGVLQPQVDPLDKQKFLDMVEVGGTDRAFLALQLDCRRARKENLWFQKPNPALPAPAVLDNQDHFIHDLEHDIFEKSDAGERMRIEFPELWELFQQHRWLHKNAMAMIVQSQLAMQGGAQEGGGEASPPRQTGQPSQPARRNPAPGNQPV